MCFFNSSTNFGHRVNVYLHTYVLIYQSCRPSYGQFNDTSFLSTSYGQFNATSCRSTSLINKNYSVVVSQLVIFIVDDRLKINHYCLLGENKKSFSLLVVFYLFTIIHDIQKKKKVHSNFS